MEGLIMTTNATVLQDVLCRRIANGNTSSNDLPLLNQLLARACRRSLLFGGGAGFAFGGLLAVLAVLAVH